MRKLDHPEKIEWQGPKPDQDEEQQAEGVVLPGGFLSAVYRGGEERAVVLRLDPERLPASWSVHACGPESTELLDTDAWRDNGPETVIVIPWEPVHPPTQLRVVWSDGEASWPLNVEDAQRLPPPAELGAMSADDLLLIIAASDPGAALRALAKRRQAERSFDDELDSTVPPDLDPLRRFDLRTTFLRRIRARARVLAQLRLNLERPIWSAQALEWRLEGFIGIRPLADRLLCEMALAEQQVDESLLTLTDFVIVLNEVEYEPVDGALSKAEFDRRYAPFLHDLIERLDKEVRTHRSRMGPELLGFWKRVVDQCRA